MHSKKYNEARGFFEEVIELNPNDIQAYNYLTEIYVFHELNPEKYLEYALKGHKIQRNSQDSVALSISYLHLSNALIQTGFINISKEFINKAILIDSNNLSAQYLAAYIEFSQDKDYNRVTHRLEKILAKDSFRIDVIQELAKVNFYHRAYEQAAVYYDRMNEIKSQINSSIYEIEDINIAFTYEQLGRLEDAQFHYQRFADYIGNNPPPYESLFKAAWFSSIDDIEKGMEELKKFAALDNISYWFIIFLEDDPIISRLSVHPDYEKVIDQINQRFWQKHEVLRSDLSEAEVIVRY